ncbi:MAG: recombinase family protein [Alphaproteobacteria bacterium]|nr:recombinase family protein [Alphaproteobacteria bacterium]
MIEPGKVTTSHQRRDALVYIRQSTMNQIEAHRESTARQYALVDQAKALGWHPDQIIVIDEDLGLSGASASHRSGFNRLTADVALGRVGIVLGLEVSRLARNNTDWYRLLDLCGMTDTLIGDGDGVYHPRGFNDRLVLGFKGTMSEAELHMLRERLDGGIRNKAARGELRRALPIGFVWGEADGEVRFHPDEAVTSAIRTVFEQFAELGSAHQVRLWIKEQKFPFPCQPSPYAEIQWGRPSHNAIHKILTNPTYAGVYAYGKTRHERYIDDQGVERKRVRRLPRAEWAVFIPDHHEGYIDWPTFEANEARLAANARPKAGQPGGAVREGRALLQGLARCGHCGRRLGTHYHGNRATPGYLCRNPAMVGSRGGHCLSVGGVYIDRAVAKSVLEAIQPAAIDAALAAADQLKAEDDKVLAQWRREVERHRYQAARAERRYRAVDPENRLVARGLEVEWEQQLRQLAEAEAEFTRREQQRRQTAPAIDRQALLALGTDLRRVWEAPTTNDRDRKALLRTLLEEVIITVDRDQYKVDLTLRWQGGMLTELEVGLPRSKPATIRTDEDTIDLVRRLAAHYPDAMIASILNQQGRTTVRGNRFTIYSVNGLRRYWKIPRFVPPAEPPSGDVVNVSQAAKILEICPSTLHRWLNDGFIAGEQLTPGAPWQIRLTDDFKNKFVDQIPDGYLPMREAIKHLGVSRQTVLQRVKRGELKAVHCHKGKKKGLYIRMLDQQTDLFDPPK